METNQRWINLRYGRVTSYSWRYVAFWTHRPNRIFTLSIIHGTGHVTPAPVPSRLRGLNETKEKSPVIKNGCRPGILKTADQGKMQTFNWIMLPWPFLSLRANRKRANRHVFQATGCLMFSLTGVQTAPWQEPITRWWAPDPEYPVYG